MGQWQSLVTNGHCLSMKIKSTMRRTHGADYFEATYLFVSVLFLILSFYNHLTCGCRPLNIYSLLQALLKMTAKQHGLEMHRYMA